MSRYEQEQERNERMVRAVWERKREANPYWSGKRCEEGCGTVCYDENAYKNHMCRPEVMRERENRNRSLNMASIVICDRDGEIVTAKVAGGATYWPNPDSSKETYTLCPNCARELYDWFRGQQDKVRAIMAPFDPDAERVPDGPTQADTSRAAIQAEYGVNPYPPTNIAPDGTRY